MKNLLSILTATLFFSITAWTTPTVPANNLTFTTIGQTTLSFTWTRGNGDKCLVTVKQAGSTTYHPTNGLAEYSTSTTYGNGTLLGGSTYCVYKGTGTSMTVYGLTANTQYTVYIYEYDTPVFPTITYNYLTSSYEVGSHYTLIAQPTVQATLLTSSAISTNSANLSWTQGNGAYELVGVRLGTSNSYVPVDGNVYTASTTYGAGSGLGSVPYSYVVYTSSGSSVSVSNLSPATDYVANCFTYDGTLGAQNYYTSSFPTEGFTTLASQPTGNCTYLYATDITNNAMTLNWVRPTVGAGSQVIVIVRAVSTADLPVDATVYSANAAFGSGSQIGSSYVVYIGTGNTVRVTGLNADSYYTVAVVEFNGGTGTFNNTTNYSTAYLTGGSYTLPAEPTTAPSNLTFSNIQTNQVTANWTNGNGAYRMVAARPTRIQTALAFDGTNDYVRVPYHVLTQPTGGLTFEMWVYKANWNTTLSGTLGGNAETSGYSMSFTGSGANIQGWVRRNASYANPQANIAHLLPGWHHFALTYDGRYTRLYVDGAEKAMDDAGANYSVEYNVSNDLIIGAEPTATVPNCCYHTGYIDNVRLWSVGQSTSAIRSNMNKSLEGNEAGLSAEWNFNDGFTTSSSAKNSSIQSNGTGLDGILMNFASTAAATSFSGSSGWIKSNALVDVPIDFNYYSPSSVFQSGSIVGNKYYSVYYSTGNSVTVTGLTPDTYYDFYVVEVGYSSAYRNYMVSGMIMEDVLTASQPVPTITSFSPTNGNIGANVTVNGTNFSSTASSNSVYFGATKATVLSSTANTMTVSVPSCANYVPLSVEVNSKNAYSRSRYVVTTSCAASITTTSFTASTYTASGTTRGGVAACDVDLDGKADLLYAEYTLGTINIVRNQSSNGTYTPGSTTSFTAATNSHYIATGDLDGDNKPDVAITSETSFPGNITVLRNNSTPGNINFGSRYQMSAAAYPTSVKIADMDGDGRLDIICGHASGTSVSVYRNTSSIGFFRFDRAVALTGIADAYAIDIADFNGDGKIDVIAGDRVNNNITVFQNNSTTGSLSFGAAVNIAMGTGAQAVATGDFDNDGKPDFCTGLQSGGVVRVYRNTNAGGAIISGNFSLQTTLTGFNTSIYGLAVNDLDGDTRNDIVVGYSTSGNISIFEHTSNFNFAARVDILGSGSSTFNLVADDFTLDGKTDIACSNFSTALTLFNSNINALASEPIGAPSNVVISGVSQNSFSITFTSGGGTNRIVVVRPSSALALTPADGVGYTGNSAYGLGSHLGAGNYVVYNGNSNSVSITGLTSNTGYIVSVYEYNGATCTANYLLTGGSANSTTWNFPPTLNSIANPSAICQSSGQQSVNLSGITSGNGSESQVLTVSATSSNTALVSNSNISPSYTSPNTTGTLNYTPTNGVSGTTVITVTVNDGASNNNTVQQTFTVTVTPPPTTANAGSNMTICAGATTLGGNLPSVGTGSWTITYPLTPTVTISNPTQYNSQISGFNIGDSVRLSWTISNAPCSPSVSYVSIKRNNCPMTADFIANQTAFCGTNATVNFTDLTYAGGNTIVNWSWSFPGGTPSTYTTSVASNPPPITYSAAGSYNVSLTVTSNIPTNDSETKNGYINITALPGTATTINGLSPVCQGTTAVTYSVAPISGASTYSWSLPPGASINGASNTNVISVDFSPTASSGTISVVAQNSCGNGSVYNQLLPVSLLPGASGVISGPTSACQGATGVIYTVPTIANATGYSWTLPPGASITAGANTNSITVSFSNSATDGSIDVNGTNGCGSGSSSSALVFTIDSLPVTPGAIAGTFTVCPGDTVQYSVADVPYASTYSWTLPAGASILGSSNTASVTVVYAINATSGNISVKGLNACGNGNNSSAAITVNPLPDPATAILGSNSVCAGSAATISYFVSAIPNASSYVWTLPSGFSIQSGAGTNAINVGTSPTASSGLVMVQGSNGCGTGTASTLSVTVSPLPDSAQAIVGPDSVCQAQTGVIFTVPAIANATGYNWLLPNGASLVAGAGTNSITIDFSSSANTGDIIVSGTNACGDGLAADTHKVVLKPLPGPGGTISGDMSIIICPPQTGVVYSVTASSAATSYNWTVPAGASIVSGAGTATITVDYTSGSTTGNISVTPVNACGSGQQATALVQVDSVSSQEICVITVDNTSSKNFLIWEKPVSTQIDSFLIYREIASVYTKIGAVKYTGVSEFTDTTFGVNPNVTSYKYKIATIDSCGNEGPLSTFHRTIHMQVSPAAPWGYNLSWNDYIGFPISQYRIRRDVNSTGNYVAVDSVSFGNNAWTDTTNFQITDTVSYYIEIDHPAGCTSSVANPNIEATNLNSSKSNIYKIADTTVTGVPGVSDNYIVTVFPNPSSGQFQIQLNNNLKGGMVAVHNVLGELLFTKSIPDHQSRIDMNLEGYPAGVYDLRIRTGNSSVNKKVVIH